MDSDEVVRRINSVIMIKVFPFSCACKCSLSSA